jgi:hypothetical protein
MARDTVTLTVPERRVSQWPVIGDIEIRHFRSSESPSPVSTAAVAVASELRKQCQKPISQLVHPHVQPPPVISSLLLPQYLDTIYRVGYHCIHNSVSALPRLIVCLRLVRSPIRISSSTLCEVTGEFRCK